MANKTKTIYDSNYIMGLVGKQIAGKYISDDFLEALKAHREIAAQLDLTTVAINFYDLGVISGKRLERAEKSHKEYISFTEKHNATN